MMEDGGSSPAWHHRLSSIFHPRLYSPQSQSLKSPVLLHLFKKAPVDQLLCCHLFGARISFSDLVERRLDRDWLDIEARLQNFQFLSVSRVEHFAIGKTDLLGHKSESQVAVVQHDFVGLGHHVHELADHLGPLRDY